MLLFLVKVVALIDHLEEKLCNLFLAGNASKHCVLASVEVPHCKEYSVSIPFIDPGLAVSP